MKKISSVATLATATRKWEKESRRSRGQRKKKKKEAQVEEFRGPIYIKLLKYSLHRLEGIESSMWVFGTRADRKFSLNDNQAPRNQTSNESGDEWLLVRAAEANYVEAGRRRGHKRGSLFQIRRQKENTRINRPAFVSFPNIFPIIPNNICSGRWDATCRRCAVSPLCEPVSVGGNRPPRAQLCWSE